MGLGILERELPEQILADGGHFERSPMYQLRLAYTLACLANAGDATLAERVAEPLARLRRAAAHLCHPDGEIALLNDSAFGIANPPGDLIDLALPKQRGRMGPAQPSDLGAGQLEIERARQTLAFGQPCRRRLRCVGAPPGGVEDQGSRQVAP